MSTWLACNFHLGPHSHLHLGPQHLGFTCILCLLFSGALVGSALNVSLQCTFVCYCSLTLLVCSTSFNVSLAFTFCALAVCTWLVCSALVRRPRPPGSSCLTHSGHCRTFVQLQKKPLLCRVSPPHTFSKFVPNSCWSHFYIKLTCPS